MKKPNRRNLADQIAVQYGMPLHEVLIAEYEKHGQKRAVATALGVRPETISRWIAKLGLKTQMVKSDQGL